MTEEFIDVSMRRVFMSGMEMMHDTNQNLPFSCLCDLSQQIHDKTY